MHFLSRFDDEDPLDFVVSFDTFCFLDSIKSNRVAINRGGHSIFALLSIHRLGKTSNNYELLFCNVVLQRPAETIFDRSFHLLLLVLPEVSDSTIHNLYISLMSNCLQ